MLINAFFFFASCSTKLGRYSNKRNTVNEYEHLNDSTLRIKKVSKDPDFGFTEKKPIMLGMVDVHKAANNILKFLNALEGPNGEYLLFQRLKPCCAFKTKNFSYTIPYFGIDYDHKRGMLEKYEVSQTDSLGKKHTSILYFNLYDETNEICAPMGFRYKVN